MFTKIVSYREFNTTTKAYKLGIGPNIISHRIIEDHDPTIHEYNEEDELSEWERHTNNVDEPWYNVTMEELYPITTITYGIFSIVSKFCETLMENGIYHMDLHKDNIMIDKDGKVVIIDYEYVVLKDDPDYPFPLPTLGELVGGLGFEAKSIRVGDEVLKLYNYSWSPYLNALFTSGIGYDKDEEGNAVFDGFDVKHVRCYLNYCDNGYIEYDTFNEELFEYMGHENINRIGLQKKWKNKHDPNGHIIYEEMHVKGFDKRTDEIMEIMDKFFYDVECILVGPIMYSNYFYKLIVFCKRNMEDNIRICLEGYHFHLIYVEDDTKPIDYIKKIKIDCCYYNGRCYTNTKK